jgi:hypothetical protein
LGALLRRRRRRMKEVTCCLLVDIKIIQMTGNICTPDYTAPR